MVEPACVQLYFRVTHVRILTMLSWKILHTFKEGMHGDEVVWFEEDYNAVRDGGKQHSGHPEVVTHLDVIKSQ